MVFQNSPKQTQKEWKKDEQILLHQKLLKQRQETTMNVIDFVIHIMKQ